MIKRCITALSLFLLGLMGAGLWAGSEGDAKGEAPSTAYPVPIRLGTVDAVTGSLNLNFPLGPRMPGRIPFGFSFGWSSGDAASRSLGGTFNPVVWPQDQSNRSLVMTVMVGGQPWVFQKRVASGVGLPDATKVKGWMSDRKVSDGYSEAVGMGTNPTFRVYRIYPSSDGTKFLAFTGWDVTTANGVKAAGTRTVVLDGHNAIWRKGLETHLTSRWGDHLQVTASGGRPGAPTDFVIKDLVTQASITLGVVETGTRSIDTTDTRIVPVSITVTNTLGYPTVTLNGTYTDRQRYIGKTIACDGVSEVPKPTGSYDAGVQVTSWSDRGTTSFTYGVPGGNPKGLTDITHPNGLKEHFGWGSAVKLSSLSFDPCSGAWLGFRKTRITVEGPETLANQAAVSLITFTGGAGSKVSQAIVIGRKQPTPGEDGTLTGETAHETYILRYGTAAPTATSAYRGTRLVHPTHVAMPTEVNSVKAYLFATAAILQTEAIHGSSVSGGTLDSGTWIPLAPVVDQRTRFEGFDLRSWANPTGSLTQGLPVNPLPRLVTVETPNLPTKVTFASSSDTWGPNRTDAYTLPSKIGLSNTQADPTVAAKMVSEVTAPAGELKRSGSLTRAWNDGLMLLLTSSETKDLSGSNLPTYRSGAGSSVSFGNTQFAYDEKGRVRTLTATRGVFTATETRTYLGDNPNPEDVTKTLQNGGVAVPPNPDVANSSAGKTYTYDVAPHFFLTSETDKTDGRTVTYTPDAYGRSTSTTDVLGFITNTVYDGFGRLESVTRQAKGTVAALATSYGYTSADQVNETSVKGSGKTFTTSKTFDELGRVISETRPGGRTQTTLYTGFGEPDSKSPWLLPSQTAYTGTKFTYDVKGRLTKTTDRGRLVSETPDEPIWDATEGAIKTVSYGPPVKAGGAKVSRTTFTDPLGQTKAILDQGGNRTTYTYAKDGQLASTTQGVQTRSYGYNDMGWLTSRTEPEEGTTTFSSFTMGGTPLVSTLGSGATAQVTTTTLNALNQPATVKVVAPGVQNQIRTFGYEPGTRFLKLIEEAQLNGALTETYTSDELGRPLTRTLKDDALQSFKIERTLDAFGNQTSLTYPSGGGRAAQVADFGFDGIGRMTDVALAGVAKGHLDRDTVNGTGHLNKLSLLNGGSTVATSTLTFDQEDLKKVEHKGAAGALLESASLTWSEAGLLVQRGTDTFDYDVLHRLTSSTVSGLASGEVMSQGFAYDRYGNRTNQTFTYTGTNKPTEVLAFSSVPNVGANRLPAQVTAASGPLDTGATYDAFGRLSRVLAIPGQLNTLMEWTYDAAGRIVMENSTKFLLDSGGLRFRRTLADGSLSYTVYGFNGEPLATFDRAITAQTTLLPGGGGGGDPAGECTATIVQPATSTTVAAGTDVTFQGASPEGTSFLWDFKDGSTATTLTAIHKFTAPGTYAVTFKASRTGLLSATATATVIVVAPVVSISIINPPGAVTLLPGKSQSFTAAVTGSSNTTVSWTATGGTFDNSQGNPVVFTAPTTPGSYTVKVKPNAAPSKEATATVTVTQPVAVSLDKTSATVQVGDGLPFTATVTGGTGTGSVSWTLSGGGSLSSTSGGTITYTAPSTQGSATLTATSTEDPTKSVSATITINPIPQIEVSLTPTSATVVAGLTKVLTATVTNTTDTRLSWQADGGTLSATSGASVTWTAPTTVGTYHVYARSVANPSIVTGATMTVTSAVQVSVSPVTAKVIPGGSTVITATVTGTTNKNVSWTVTGGTLSGTNPVTWTAPTTEGVYTVTAKSNADPAKTATTTVTVQILRRPTIQVFTGAPTMIGVGESTTLAWTVVDADTVTIDKIGTVTATGNRNVFPTATTLYTMTATNASGTATANVRVSVLGGLTWKRTVVHGFGQVVSEEKPTGTFYMLGDQVGSPNYVLNSAGTVVGRAKNLPFGERFGQTGEKSIRRYTNHEDQDGSAIYMQARMYLPAYGKIAQVDPAYDQTKDDPESWNLYSYVTNNPVTKTDPDGRMRAQEYMAGPAGGSSISWQTDYLKAFENLSSELAMMPDGVNSMESAWTEANEGQLRGLMSTRVPTERTAPSTQTNAGGAGGNFGLMLGSALMGQQNQDQTSIKIVFDTSSVNGHIAIQNADGTFGYNPNMNGGPIPAGGDIQRGMQGLMWLMPTNPAVPGEARKENPREFQGSVAVNVTGAQSAALAKSIAQNMTGLYNVKNQGAPNCAGWVCGRLADAKISPIPSDKTGQFFRSLSQMPYLTPRQVGEYILSALSGVR